MITDTEADIGSDLRWSCAAAGKPRPAVRWLRDGQPLTSQVPARAAATPPCAPGLAVLKLLLHILSPFCLAANPSRPPWFITPLPCAPIEAAKRWHGPYPQQVPPPVSLPSQPLFHAAAGARGQFSGQISSTLDLPLYDLQVAAQALRSLSRQHRDAWCRLDAKKKRPTFSPTENQAGSKLPHESVMKLSPEHTRPEFHLCFSHLMGSSSCLPVQNRIEVSGGELRFSKLVLEDSGMYQCVAENKHGTVYASAELTVQGNFSFPSALGFNGTLKHFRSLPDILCWQSQ